MEQHKQSPGTPPAGKDSGREAAPVTPERDRPSHEPAPVDMASESAAGEEDPGASIDLAIEPPSDPPSGPKP